MPPAIRHPTPPAPSPAVEAATATTYRRAAGQRCWVCNAPDSEPVRLQRRAGTRWVGAGTVWLCTACLTALCTPRLVRQLDLGRAASGPPAPTPEAASGASPAPTRDAPDEPPPLTLLKGA